MNIDFEPQKAFNCIDTEKKGLIEREDLMNYMKKNYNRISSSEAESVIKEFDSNFDGTLNFEEFCQMILPSTN
jgi:Ca2+-binding EF-hand superfamily protein